MALRSLTRALFASSLAITLWTSAAVAAQSGPLPTPRYDQPARPNLLSGPKRLDSGNSSSVANLVRNQLTATAIIGGQRGAETRALDRLSSLKVVKLNPAATTTVKEYVSYHKVSPDAAFSQLTRSLEAKLVASGVKVVRSDPSRPLANGERFYIIPKLTPVLMPCRLNIDSVSRKITIETLSHHPFQGTNAFQVKADGKGGTALVQTASFQATSKTMGAVSHTPMVDRPQNTTWRKFHETFSSKSSQN